MMHKKITLWTAIIIFVALFAASSFSYFKTEAGRRIFYFPGPGGQVCTEVRWLPQYADAEPSAFTARRTELERYVAELLLGPENTHLKPLFSPQTRAISCFESDGTLYIDLSAHALFPGETACPIKEGAELLKKNVQRNFERVTGVSLFIDGKKAFEEFE
jgi:hypothetical protein